MKFSAPAIINSREVIKAKYDAILNQSGRAHLYIQSPEQLYQAEILPRASTVVFVTAPHPGDSVPGPVSVPQPTRTADRAASFCD